jgi:hypothetical protein
MRGICICSLYDTICHRALNGVLGFSWLLYVWHLCLFFVSVFWRSTEFWLSAGWYLWGTCICFLHLSSGAQQNRVLSFIWLVYVGHLYLFFVSVTQRSTGFSVSAGWYMWGICSLYLSSGAQRGAGFQLAGICVECV